MSPQWCEDLSSSTLEEIIQLESDNRAWRKELKIKVDSLEMIMETMQDEYNDVSSFIA